jgi:hypothetical protein
MPRTQKKGLCSESSKMKSRYYIVGLQLVIPFLFYFVFSPIPAQFHCDKIHIPKFNIHTLLDSTRINFFFNLRALSRILIIVSISVGEPGITGR